MESDKKKILIVDDEKELCLVLRRFLERKGFEVVEAYKGRRALEIARTDTPDVILCDFMLDDMDGITFLKSLKEFNSSIPVIIITGFNNIKAAVEVIRLGAIDYIIKPLIPDEIIMVIRKVLEEEQKKKGASTEIGAEQRKETEGEASDQSKPDHKSQAKYIFGDSPYFNEILRQIKLVAPTNYSVIIYGESGSGKEAIAQEIHKRSKRSDKPFMAIDCGVLSKELAGSELFGHEKGSFTGAIAQKIGSFELANGGTVFLDEVANLSYEIQVSLLRVVQERKMRRVGGTRDIALDIRIILASNEKLWDASGSGRIREDLFHRFNEFMINVPPLRERQEDILVFANHFLNISNSELHKDIKGFHPEVERIFKNYAWHGNLRELKNVVKRAALLCDEKYIDVKSIPFELTNFNRLQFEGEGDDFAPVKTADTSLRELAEEKSLKKASIDAEYELILDALKKVNFNKSKAAKILQIDRKTLYYKIKQYQSMSAKNPKFSRNVFSAGNTDANSS